MDVTVLGKRQRTDVHTVLAAGGINAAFGNVDQEDSWEQHFADTYIEGYGLSEPEVVELMAKESPQLVEEIDNWGANFAKLDNGKIDQRFFGAHTYRRTCYSGDYTGRSILFALINKAKTLDIPILDSQYVSDLLVDDKGREFGCEVETKTGCHGPEFNYPALHIPFRRQTFTDDRVTFFVLNSGRTHAAVISRQKLLKSPVVQVKNNMVPMGDYFYEIDPKDVEFVNLLARTS